MRLFHGTTIENMYKILEEGFNQPNKNWSASEDNLTYFYTEEFFMKEYNGIESDEELVQVAIPYTMDQARITLALQNPKDYRGAVLVFESDYMDNGTEIEPDYSCGDIMADSAVCLNNPDMKGLVAVYIMTNEESLTRIHNLSLLKKNEHVNLGDYLTEFEQKMVNSYNSNESYYEELHENYEQLELSIFNKEFDLKKVA